MIEIAPISPEEDSVQYLLQQLNEYLEKIYPSESNYIDSVDELKKQNVVFLGASIDAQVVGCGAVKFLQDDISYGEIKRVYVCNAARGRGIAEALMRGLEAAAIDRKVKVLRLETGHQQPEALGLYEKLGYACRGPFASYIHDNNELSLFMEKQL